MFHYSLAFGLLCLYIYIIQRESKMSDMTQKKLHVKDMASMASAGYLVMPQGGRRSSDIAVLCHKLRKRVNSGAFIRAVIFSWGTMVKPYFTIWRGYYPLVMRVSRMCSVRVCFDRAPPVESLL